MQAFFKRVAAGEKPGVPRVRPRHQFLTLCYPAMYVQVEGKTVLLPTGGGRGKKHKPYPTIRAELTEAVPSGYQEVSISRDPRGHYHASFVYEVAEQAPRTGEVAAFDLGIKTLAVGYNGRGRFYHIGGFKGYRWYNKQLDKIHSRQERCQKKSRRYIHLSKVYQRVSERKRNKRKDSPTGCATRCLYRMKWLQIALCCQSVCCDQAEFPLNPQQESNVSDSAGEALPDNITSLLLPRYAARGLYGSVTPTRPGTALKAPHQ